MSAVKKLLAHIVDYAGLFPPASLELSETVRNYRDYLATDSSWMLSRLIIPAARLTDLAAIWGEAGDSKATFPWRISALVPPIDAPNGAFSSAFEAIDRFNQRHRFAVVDSVEGKVAGPEQVAPTIQEIPANLNTFLEVSYQDPDASLATIADNGRPGLFAKIRTGSVLADQIPSSERIAHFLQSCVTHQLGLKFTAGLHHPVRAIYPLTYEPDSDRSEMHGFINVFLASTLAFAKAGSFGDIQDLLDETTTANFSISNDLITWRGYQFGVSDLEKTRKHFAISFGSCSFEEPFTELIELGWLESTAKTV